MTAPLAITPAVDPVLAVALARAGASGAVALAAAQRFRDWRAAPGALERTVAYYRIERPWMRVSCPEEHPTAEQAARAIVAACVEAERVGLLERPVRAGDGR